jgi:hypothetical protein
VLQCVPGNRVLDSTIDVDEDLPSMTPTPNLLPEDENEAPAPITPGV